MSVSITRGQAATITDDGSGAITLNDKDGGVYTGTTLTNQEVSALVYEDGGSQAAWTVSGVLTHISGNNWQLQLSESETNQSEAYGIIMVAADDIVPYQLNIVFSDSAGGGGEVVGAGAMAISMGLALA
jgi:hypothetical protein